MPVITVDIGPMPSKEKKAELIQALTDAAVAVTNIPIDKFTVLIKEMNTDNIGVAGKSLTSLLNK